MTITTSRRGFLKATGAAVAVLAIGVDPKGALANTASGGGNITPFVTISEDGTVTAIIKHFEGGQGVSTGLSALIAEELNMSLTDIQWTHAPSDPTRYANLFFGGFQGTGGSTAMANSYMQYRTAGAAARELLISAAAKEWSVDAAQLSLKDGVISGAGKEGPIGAFVAAASAMEVPAEPRLKDPSEFRIIGKEIKARRDTHDKINGQAKYAMDVHLDGQMVAALKRAPNYGAKVVSFDDSAAKEVPGFIMAQTLPNSDAVVAFAENTWAAFQARDALSIEWDMSNAEKRSSDQIKDELLAAVNADPQYVASETDLTTANAALDGAAKVVEQEFYFPMLAHAPMEPMGATIEPLADGGVIIHDGAQFPTANNMVLNQILQIPMEKIQVNTLYAGGFFGRRATPNSDYLVELTLAFAVTDRTRPVKLVWSREDDITGGYYRPAMAHKVRAGIDAEGNIVGWDHRVAGQSIMKGTAFEPMIVQNGVDHSSVEGIADGAYTIPTMHLALTDAAPSTSVNWWRSVGHSHTGYVMESMMDMLAEAAGADPVEFRHINESSGPEPPLSCRSRTCRGSKPRSKSRSNLCQEGGAGFHNPIGEIAACAGFCSARKLGRAGLGHGSIAWRKVALIFHQPKDQVGAVLRPFQVVGRRIGGGRHQEPGQHRRLGRVDLVGRLAEIALRGGLEPARSGPQIGPVEIDRQDVGL